jgi:PTH2 family peptidyl-tRNA hydrolase
MSEDNLNGSILHWKVPLWQVAVGLAAVFAIQYIVNRPKHRVKRSKSQDILVNSSGSSNQNSAVALSSAETKSENDTEKAVTKAASQKQNEETSSDDEDEEETLQDKLYNYLFYGEPYHIENNYTRADGHFKMILVVNNELKMGKGKIAAQVGHATLGAYTIAKKFCKSGLQIWERKSAHAKVCLKVEEEKEMYEIYENAKAIGIVAYIVCDAGRTQIAAGSRTVLALGPAPVMLLDQLTGHLKLL